MATDAREEAKKAITDVLEKHFLKYPGLVAGEDQLVESLLDAIDALAQAKATRNRD